MRFVARADTLPVRKPDPEPYFETVRNVVPNQARRKAHELVLSNAFGFGGTNASLVFQKA